MNSLKDQLLLLAAGLGCAFVAWAIFHFAGDQAWLLIVTLTLIGVSADNARLRRRLRRRDEQAPRR